MDSLPAVDPDQVSDAAFVSAALLPGRLRRPRLRDLAARNGGLRALRLRAAGEEFGLDATPAEASALGAALADDEMADRVSAFLGRDDARVAFAGESGYPGLLGETADAPIVLFGRSRSAGGLDELPLPIAIVGARHASTYGREAATRLARDLAASGVTVVSGLARGVDQAAHRASLEGRPGSTVAVLGSGIDVDYPRENRSLAAEIVETGGWVVSEYPPGARPRPEFFPERNRIIAGLSRGVVVAEAAERSGSLITARLALEEGREVWAVPGSIFSATSAGALQLLRQGARPVGSAADILSDLPIELLRPLVPETLAAAASSSGDFRARWLLEELSIEEPRGADELSGRSGRNVPAVLAALLEGEIEGFVRPVPGARWVRTEKRLS